MRSIVKETSTSSKAEDESNATNAMSDEDEYLDETKEEDLQTMKKKIHAMQKANWRLRKQKETLRSQLDHVSSILSVKQWYDPYLNRQRKFKMKLWFTL